MQISVNNKEREVADGITVQQLLHELSIIGPLAVALNRKVCPKNQHSQVKLKNGDMLEIITIVAGG